jgi:hypothetical protein
VQQPPSGRVHRYRMPTKCRLAATAIVPGHAPIAGYVTEYSTIGAVFVSDSSDVPKSFELQIGPTMLATAYVVRRNEKTLILRFKPRAVA